MRLGTWSAWAIDYSTGIITLPVRIWVTHISAYPAIGVYNTADVNPTTGDITITPYNHLYRADTSYDYTAKTTDGQTVTGRVDYISQPVTGAAAASPVAAPDTTTTPAGEPVTLDILANDTSSSTSAPFNTATVRLRATEQQAWATDVTLPGQGTFTVTPVSGQVTFSPAARFAGTTDPVTYQVTDVLGATVEATITVTVNAAARVAPAPAATPEPTLGRRLPTTGADSVLLGLLGAGFIAVGALMVVGRRRRDDES